jgi:Tfp pilus assembly protein PilN
MAVGVGVELAPGAVRGAVVESAGARLKLLAVHEVPCDAANPDILARALGELRSVLRIAAPVVLGVPGTSAILTTISPLVVNLPRAALAVQFELQQLLPFALSDAVWHFRWLASENGEFGVRSAESKRAIPHSAFRIPHSTGAIVAAMRRPLLDERMELARRAGLCVRAVALSPLALLNAWDLEPANARAKSVTLLNLANQPVVEWILRSPGTVQVVPVTSQSSETLWGELAASWQALQEQGVQPALPVRVVGPSTAMPRVQEALAASAAVEAVDVTRLAASSGALPEHAARWAVALGLAAQALDRVPCPLNLLASFQTAERSSHVRRAAWVVSALAALAIFGVGLAGMLEVRQRRVAVLQALERQERLYQTLRPEVRALLQRQHQVEQRSQQLEGLITQAPVLTQVLAQVSEALPEAVWLTSLEVSKSGTLLEGLAEGRGKSFQDVTQFLDRLKTIGGMTTVKPLSTNVTTDPATEQEVIAFSAQIQRPLGPSAASGEGSAPATSLAPKKPAKAATSARRVKRQKPAKETP